MNTPTIALISTQLDLAVELRNRVKELMPEAKVLNFVDDSVVPTIIREGGRLNARMIQRITDSIVSAEHSGAQVALVTCSSISETVDAARKMVSIPVLKIDEPMMEEALSRGTRIGVLATLSTTLEPTVRLCRRKAGEQGSSIEVKPLLIEGAFEALTRGREDEHDAMIREAIGTLETTCDCVILAQASMARAIRNFKAGIPVLTSPPGGLQAACKLLREVQKD